jgi:ectoine hydroxylase-related dioxygenase (phytanoyl-CoA dioxygenase family)
MEDPYFQSISEGHRLSAEQQQQLLKAGFVVLPDMVPKAAIAALQEAYDATMASGKGNDYKVGSSTTRLNDFVNRSAAFDALYLYAPLLSASSLVIGAPFKLSSMLGRTLRPHTAAQDLHADLRRDSDAFPMVGFILMVDAFRPDNGATRFVPGSHLRTESPEIYLHELRTSLDYEVLACGHAGAVTIFNASVWHGHTANLSDDARRSIQGYFVPRGARSGSNPSAGMKPETLARIGPLANYLLAV